jgi:hypothetical protein
MGTFIVAAVGVVFTALGAELHHYWEDYRKTAAIPTSKDNWKKFAKKKEAEARRFARNDPQLIKMGKKAALCFPGIMFLTISYMGILCTSVRMGWV